jgi:hypothetical protein
MRAIMATATPQAVIILFGSFVITAIGLGPASVAMPAGAGWGELVASAKGNAENFALWRPLSDPDFPWLGVLIASPIIGIWYWCTDQYIVQRTLTAKDLATARRGALFGGLLKVWPVLIFLIPGMIGWTLDQKFNRGADDPLLTQQYPKDISKDEKKAGHERRQRPPARTQRHQQCRRQEGLLHPARTETDECRPSRRRREDVGDGLRHQGRPGIPDAGHLACCPPASAA